MRTLRMLAVVTTVLAAGCEADGGTGTETANGSLGDAIETLESGDAGEDVDADCPPGQFNDPQSRDPAQCFVCPLGTPGYSAFMESGGGPGPPVTTNPQPAQECDPDCVAGFHCCELDPLGPLCVSVDCLAPSGGCAEE